jgi:hypothetical protein
MTPGVGYDKMMRGSLVLVFLILTVPVIYSLSDLSVHASRQGKLIIPQPGDESTTQSPSFQGGGMDWIKTCNDLQTALVSSCEVLVNPDNTLTTEGERAVGCIRNGIALAGVGSLLLSLPLPLVITALQILEEPTGCGGIVEWGLIGDVGDLKGIINRLA